LSGRPDKLLQKFRPGNPAVAHLELTNIKAN
jgi:hypothetical protein